MSPSAHPNHTLTCVYLSSSSSSTSPTSSCTSTSASRFSRLNRRPQLVSSTEVILCTHLGLYLPPSPFYLPPPLETCTYIDLVWKSIVYITKVVRTLASISLYLPPSPSICLAGDLCARGHRLPGHRLGGQLRVPRDDRRQVSHLHLQHARRALTAAQGALS